MIEVKEVIEVIASIVDKFLPCKPSDDINFDNFEQSDNFRKLSNPNINGNHKADK